MHNAKSRAPSQIAYTGSRANKHREYVHVFTSCACLLMSLPEGREKEYSIYIMYSFIVLFTYTEFPLSRMHPFQITYILEKRDSNHHYEHYIVMLVQTIILC